MTMDVVTVFAFGQPTSCSLAENFESPLAKGVQGLNWGAHWNAHFKFINDAMGLLPFSVMLKLMPAPSPIMDF
jgi:hypothetical protein